MTAVTMTEEAYEVWSQGRRTEFVNGMVVEMSPESDRSEDLRIFLSSLLKLYLEYHQIGLVRGPNLETRLRAGLRRVPDLLLLIGSDVERLRETGVDGPPTVAVEIVSQDSQERDRVDKLRDYERVGVREYWLVDPLRNEAIFYRLSADAHFHAVPLEDGIFRSEAVPGFWLKVEWIVCEPCPPVLPILRLFGILS